MKHNNIRNIAIIAHVDHGKTTLLDVLFRQTNTLDKKIMHTERIMDSNPLEKERGITILAKNASLFYKDIKINVIDTPGHADFSGEVERILNMVDGVLLLVDAFEGPMPQTRFVTRKALALGLKPIVVINKIDRPGSRPEKVHDMVFDLFVECHATDTQLDFPCVYASAKDGYAVRSLEDPHENILPLLDYIISEIPTPPAQSGEPFQMLVSDLQYDTFLGSLMVGRIHRGTIKTGMQVVRILPDGVNKNFKVQTIFGFHGLERREISIAYAGDIIIIAGLDDGKIGETLADPLAAEALPVIKVEEPTLSMNFMVNTSPLAGKEGKYVTSRQIRERLFREAKTNISMRAEDTGVMGEYKVSGRGELHLSILIETMRREGYEFAVSYPQVLYKTIDGVMHEPVEDLQIEVPESFMGAVLEELGRRKAEIQDIQEISAANRSVRAIIPTRGLLGFRTLFLTLTRGEGIMSYSFYAYQPFKGKTVTRQNGVLIAHKTGESIPYGMRILQDRGSFIIPPNIPVYEGMIVGINNRDNDLTVNVCTTKKLTNMRASGKDDAVRLIPHIQMSLEQSLEFIANDELVEITPKSIRLRKRFLQEHERKRFKNSREKPDSAEEPKIKYS